MKKVMKRDWRYKLISFMEWLLRIKNKYHRFPHLHYTTTVVQRQAELRKKEVNNTDFLDAAVHEDLLSDLEGKTNYMHMKNHVYHGRKYRKYQYILITPKKNPKK